MLDLTGKTIVKVDFKNFGECEVKPDFCDGLVIEFSDGSKLYLDAESSQDNGYIEVTLTK